ncbi:ABC transporter substrate-binding protein [Chroococcidiopsis sp. FACHB-1243]|uniref:ABC transporter substrate-binding protein n=1 Tax=Chroococcidiopsis sp. [FACHB-1243] TaxID=2692781 RepID=UPI001781AB22|nr:ABC transporter substrate-binding protein [Chroococcidiopsis sp. [FACHB-1243]]MBD2305536.1 ABC transporter substrate-binding protein [Chroococcidiopsis sp. [FACHB-1243]]
MSKINQYWSRRHALWMMAGTTGSFVLHGCDTATQTPSPSPTAAKPVSATIGILNWIGLTPLHIALEKGFFKQAGIDLQPKIFGSNPDSNAAFIAGRLDALAPVTSEAILIASKGRDFRVVLVEDISVGGDGILARNSVTDIKAFKGKKVAVERASVSHFFLLQVLAEAGLSEKDITIVSTTPDAAAAAYQTGQVEIAVSYAPFLQKANQAQKDGRIIYDSAKMPTAISDLYVFDAKFIQANPQAVQAFVNGVLQGLDFLNKNPKEGLASAAKRLETTPDSLAADLKGIKLPDAATNIEMFTNSQSELYILNSMKSMAEFLSSQKQIEKVPDMSKFIEPKFVKAAQNTI